MFVIIILKVNLFSVILGKPGPPILLGGSVDASSVGLRWKGSTQMPDMKYLVQYRSQGSNDWIYHEPSKPLTTSQASVKGLVPYVKYQVGVAYYFYFLRQYLTQKKL